MISEDSTATRASVSVFDTDDKLARQLKNRQLPREEFEVRCNTERIQPIFASKAYYTIPTNFRIVYVMGSQRQSWSSFSSLNVMTSSGV